MPVENNNFNQFRNTERAQRAALTAMGVACNQVAKPNTPAQTGNLRRSHKYVVNGDHVDVGVTAEYGGYVHNGTSKQKARPWLKEAAQKNRDAIMASGERAYKGALD